MMDIQASLIERIRQADRGAFFHPNPMSDPSQQNDPALSVMAMDILDGVLANADDPGKVGRHLTGSLRELTGARCVLLLQCQPPKTTPALRVLSINPPRWQEWAESAAAAPLFDIVRDLTLARIWRASDNSPAAGLLRQEGFELSLCMPLNVGHVHVGALLLLGLPDATHLDSEIHTLEMLSTVVALVLRNALLFERQEQTIQERTRELLELIAEHERVQQSLRESEERFRQMLAESTRARRALLDTLEDQIRAEAALRESEDRYRQMLGSVTDYIYRVEYKDGSPCSTSHGPGCENVTGYRPGDFAANPFLWLTMVHPGDRKRVEEHSRRVESDETPGPIEHRILHKDGSVLWIRNTLLPRRDVSGRLVACEGMITDITERRRAEEALRVSEQKFAAAFQGCPEAISITSAATGRYLDVNDVFLKTVGFRREEVVGRLSHDLKVWVDPKDRDRWLALMQSNGHVHGYETPFRMHSGEIRLFEVSSEKIEINREPCYLHFIHDITLQKESEGRIRQQAALLDQTQDAVLVTDMEGRLRYCNKSAGRFFGMTESQLIGQGVERLMFPGKQARFREACLTTLEKGAWSGEATATSSVGSCALSSRWTLIRDAFNRPDSFLIVNTDVTEQKRLEEQFLRAQRMESIGTLASGVAHDLNNILAPILMGADSLEPLARGSEEKEIIGLLRSSARRGADIVRQLLMFGRGAQGQRSHLQPGSLLKEMVRVMQETFPKSIRLEQDFPENLGLIHADPTQVHQVLMNLCVNARDAMPNGGTLSLSAENLVIDDYYAAMNREARPGPYVVIQVSDTGMGIPPEILHKIFDPFFTTKDPGKGTGLGLSTVLGIVKGHGGFTQVTSRPGQGSCFKIYFPAIEQKQALPGPPRNTIATPRGHNELILIVDDEEVIRNALQRILLQFGYHVMSTGNGADALVVFSKHKTEIAAVVTDMVMPVMDGPTLIQSLRHLAPQLSIIGMSGLEEQYEDARKAGMTEGAFLIKPFDPIALLRLLRKVLDAPQKT
jgi:PAS domain S-box-containing protein